MRYRDLPQFHKFTFPGDNRLFLKLTDDANDGEKIVNGQARFNAKTGVRAIGKATIEKPPANPALYGIAAYHENGERKPLRMQSGRIVEDRGIVRKRTMRSADAPPNWQAWIDAGKPERVYGVRYRRKIDGLLVETFDFATWSQIAAKIAEFRADGSFGSVHYWDFPEFDERGYLLLSAEEKRQEREQYLMELFMSAPTYDAE